MAWKRVKKWSGGYVREDETGRTAYVIEKWHGGARYHLSTRCSSERAANRELERFELDPAGYRPADDDERGAVLAMTPELILEYRAHQLGKEVTAEWSDEVARCLAQWADVLGRKDLRKLDLHRDIKPALDSWKTRRPHRIKALKGFFRWLRAEKGLMRPGNDATIDLRVPQARPEKWKRRKVVAPEDVSAVLLKLPPQTRDVLHLLTATAWHLSEVRRFAGAGEITQPLQGEGVLAILFTRHKNGELAKMAVRFPEHLEAAKRIRASKRFPTRVTIARHMKTACAAAGVPWFGMGQMRHSVLTWGVQAGATIQAASEFANHKSSTTTRRYYVDLAVPGTQVPLLRLHRD